MWLSSKKKSQWAKLMKNWDGKDGSGEERHRAKWFDQISFCTFDGNVQLDLISYITWQLLHQKKKTVFIARASAMRV